MKGGYMKKLVVSSEGIAVFGLLMLGYWCSIILWQLVNKNLDYNHVAAMTSLEIMHKEDIRKLELGCGCSQSE